jgi:hypothetical protein
MQGISHTVDAGAVMDGDVNTQDVGGQDKIRPLWRHYFVGTGTRTRRGLALNSARLLIRRVSLSCDVSWWWWW